MHQGAQALALHQAGYSPTVYEAVPKLEPLGVGINLLPHAMRELTELGLLEDLRQIGVEIQDYLDILSSRARIITIIRDELTAIKSDFAVPRRTEIVEMEGELEDEDLIARTDADSAGLLATGRDSTFQNKVHLALQAKGFFDKGDDGAA